MANRLFKAFSGYLDGISSDKLILFTAGILVIIVNPAVGFFKPCCLIKEITGFYCAGCGMTTGFYALARGDFSSAFEKNLLILTLFPVGLFYLALRKIIYTYTGRIYLRYDKIIITVLILIVIVFTVCRNIPNSQFDVLRPH